MKTAGLWQYQLAPVSPALCRVSPPRSASYTEKYNLEGWVFHNYFYMNLIFLELFCNPDADAVVYLLGVPHKSFITNGSRHSDFRLVDIS